MNPKLTSLLKATQIILLAVTLTSCLKKYDIDPEKQLGPATVTAINPTSGIAGDTITITGTNFTTVLANNSVSLNDVNATVIAASRTELKVKAPAAGTTGFVKVSVNSNASVTGAEFTYLPAIAITEISPAASGAGREILLTGSNFSTVAAENIVTFNGVLAKVTSNTSNGMQLLVEVPQGATTGPVQVRVKSRVGTSNGFKVISDAASLTWTEITAPVTMDARVDVAAIGNTLIFSNRNAATYTYRLQNNQLTPVVFEDGHPNRNLYITASDNAFYASVYSNGTIFRSDDLGVTWKKIAVRASFYGANTVFGRIIARGDTVFVSNGAQNFLSKDKGETWELYGTSVNNVFYLYDYAQFLQFVSDKAGKYYYMMGPLSTVGTPGFFSSDKGLTWSGLATPLGYKYPGSVWGFRDCIKVGDLGILALFGEDSSLPASTVRLFRSDYNEGWKKVTDEMVNAIDCSGSYMTYGYTSFNASSNGGITFKNYAIPGGYIIGGIKDAGGYFYIFCTSVDGTQKKIFRAQHP